MRLNSFETLESLFRLHEALPEWKSRGFQVPMCSTTAPPSDFFEKTWVLFSVHAVQDTLKCVLSLKFDPSACLPYWAWIQERKIVVKCGFASNLRLQLFSVDSDGAFHPLGQRSQGISLELHNTAKVKLMESRVQGELACDMKRSPHTPNLPAPDFKTWAGFAISSGNLQYILKCRIWYRTCPLTRPLQRKAMMPSVIGVWRLRFFLACSYDSGDSCPSRTPALYFGHEDIFLRCIKNV